VAGNSESQTRSSSGRWRGTKTSSPDRVTYCGNPALPVTWDDPFPRALWAGSSKDRPLKVPSCKGCNNRSNASIVKHFFIVFDNRFYPEMHRPANGGLPVAAEIKQLVVRMDRCRDPK
jgi:hypothetical protein